MTTKEQDWIGFGFELARHIEYGRWRRGSQEWSIAWQYQSLENDSRDNISWAPRSIPPRASWIGIFSGPSSRLTLLHDSDLLMKSKVTIEHSVDGDDPPEKLYYDVTTTATRVPWPPINQSAVSLTPLVWFDDDIDWTALGSSRQWLAATALLFDIKKSRSKWQFLGRSNNLRRFPWFTLLLVKETDDGSNKGEHLIDSELLWALYNMIKGIARRWKWVSSMVAIYLLEELGCWFLYQIKILARSLRTDDTWEWFTHHVHETKRMDIAPCYRHARMPSSPPQQEPLVVKKPAPLPTMRVIGMQAGDYYMTYLAFMENLKQIIMQDPRKKLVCLVIPPYTKSRLFVGACFLMRYSNRAYYLP